MDTDIEQGERQAVGRLQRLIDILTGERRAGPARGTGRLLTDGSLLNLDLLDPLELVAYRRDGTVPARLGKPASARQAREHADKQRQKDEHDRNEPGPCFPGLGTRY